MCEGRGTCAKCVRQCEEFSKRWTENFFSVHVKRAKEDNLYVIPGFTKEETERVRSKENLDQGRYVYPTFSLKEENHALAEDVLVERINAILKAKENKPKYYFCAFEKTEKGVWHVHCLLYYEKSGHQGLGASFFKRYWNLGYVHLEKVTVDEPSISRIATYFEKQPYLKIGSKEMILKPLKATQTP